MHNFKVGDRVISTGTRYGFPVEKTTGVVGKIRSQNYICVHFDDPNLERTQSYEGGWYFTDFELLDDAAIYVKEDWS